MPVYVDPQMGPLRRRLPFWPVDHGFSKNYRLGLYTKPTQPPEEIDLWWRWETRQHSLSLTSRVSRDSVSVQVELVPIVISLGGESLRLYTRLLAFANRICSRRSSRISER